jgi:signal transduction histidine kinase/membrane-bound lytic murein transglycosylase MltF
MLANSIGLTEEEMQWLSQHRAFRLGVDPAWEPYESINNSEVYRGIVADYMRVLETRLGISLVPVRSANWSETFKLIRESQIDVSSALVRTEEREQFLNFTRPYIKITVGIATRENHAAVTNLAELAGKKVALPRGYVYSEMTVKQYPEIQPVFTDTILEGLKKLANGDVEGVVCDTPALGYKIREYNLVSLKIAGFVPFEEDGLRIGVRKDWPILVGILQKALDSMTADEEQQIRQRWIGLDKGEPQLDLTEAERQWLRANPVISVMVDPNWAPIEYLDKNGAAAGVTSEYLNRISQMLRVRLEPVQRRGWWNMMRDLDQGKIAMASCMLDFPVRRKTLLFTPSYITIPAGIFTRNEVAFTDMKALAGRPVAVVKGHAISDFVRTAYPEVVIVDAEDRRHGLEMVSQGRAYAYLDSLPVGCHGINYYRFTNLRLTGEVDFKYEMSMAVSTNYPQLAGILRKALRAIPESDRAGFYEKWFSAPVVHETDYSIFWKLGLLAGGVIMMFAYWSWRLERRVRERTAALATANQRLENELKERERMESGQKQLEAQLAQAQKMESIGRLAGGVAHDFNNMLCVILGHGELLQGDLPADSPAQESLAQIMDAGGRARNLTQQLLAYSRKQVLQIQTVDLNPVVQNMETMIRRLLGEDIRMSIRLDSRPAFIRVDVTRLEQVILNLCINARDAMPDGGDLTLQTGLVTLDEAFCETHPGLKPGPYAMLSVRDTGCGMSPETLERIFDPFFTTKEMSKGTGLGLATVYGIVKQHGGEVLVDSAPGVGSVFHIYLPETSEVTVPAEEVRHEPVVLSRGETILVVEDEEALRKLTCSMLRRLGYEVLSANTPNEAVRMASKLGKVDLLLTDVVMPGMNGREVCERIQAFCPKLKTLFMSGYTDEVIGRHGILEEEVHFISKPFNARTLSQKIRETLDA